MLSPPRMAMVLLSVLFSLACSSTAGTDVTEPTVDTVETLTVDGRVEEVLLGADCKSVADCDSTTDCTIKAACVDGECIYEFAELGTFCDEGCFQGFCDGYGECGALQEIECPETDGNLCTTPSCDTETGECGETLIENGLPPYASSDCFEGAICVDGEQDNSQAVPTELALECETMTAGLEAFGCVSEYVCVGGVDGCKAVPRPDGVQCWTDDGGDDEDCPGASCQEGVCLPDSAFDASCGQDDFPDECEGGCLACTRLTCYWIPDPANPDNPQKKVRYCQPGAVVSEPCGDDPCFVDQLCAFGAQADGPVGKETLGVCSGGVEKSKQECLEELGKPALDCLMAATACDPAEGGCYIKQDIADGWCWPPEWKCFDKSDTYCTHLESGEYWDPETGCHTAWVDLDCNDENDCTVDSCKTTGDEWVCEHQPVVGAACDDGNSCTVGEQCVDGECGAGALKCVDADQDPCNDPGCDPDTGECLPPQTDGVLCDDGSSCTVGDQCALGVCEPGQQVQCSDGNLCNGVETCDPDTGCQDGVPLVCDDNNACNGVESCSAQDGCLPGQALSCNDKNVCTDDSCDAATGCVNEPNALPCEDGNASTLGDFCLDGQCVPGTPIQCDDQNVCTDDLADEVEGCSFVPNFDPCDDFDACTVNDTCAGGDCISGPPQNCNDNNPCTDDSCHQVQGCSNVDMQDGTPCQGGGQWSCQGGQCACAPVCDGLTCGSDGCAGQCECNPGFACENGLCVGDCVPNKFKVCYQTDVWYFDSCNNPEEIFDDCTNAEFCLDNMCQLPLYNGQWYITANPSQQTIGGFFPITFPPQIMTLTVTGSSAHGIITYQGTNMNYLGTVNGKNMSLTADYMMGGFNIHDEWEMTFTSPTQFQGVGVESNPLGNVIWNLTGDRQ